MELISFIRKIGIAAICFHSLSAWSQDQVVGGDLDVQGQALVHGPWVEHFYDNLSGRTDRPTLDSNRYEIGRIFLNSHHWQSTTPIIIEMNQANPYQGISLKFLITAGYLNFDGAVTLLESTGSIANQSANVVLGDRVLTGSSSGGYPNLYLPIYVDLGYYSYWDIKVTHSMVLTQNDIEPLHNRVRFFEAPSAVLVTNYVPKAQGYDPLASRSLFAAKIGIGTSTPSKELEVNGTIRAKEVIVEAAPWPDYVFEKGYELQSLEEVKRHIAKHGKLPGVPSAAEIGSSGISLGESQRVLLEKIEELTLHLIKQDERIKNLTKESAEQKQLIKSVLEGSGLD